MDGLSAVMNEAGSELRLGESGHLFKFDLNSQAIDNIAHVALFLVTIVHSDFTTTISFSLTSIPTYSY